MEEPMEEPLGAKASLRPCQLYRRHAPTPSRTDGHHRHPVYLQNRLYGNIQDTELLWVCGTCHQNTHEALSWMLGEARQPDPMPGRNALREAKYAYDWYMTAKADIDSNGTDTRPSE